MNGINSSSCLIVNSRVKIDLQITETCLWKLRGTNAREIFLLLHFNVCQLSLLTFKMVLMTLMLASMKVYFSLLYAQ